MMRWHLFTKRAYYVLALLMLLTLIVGYAAGNVRPGRHPPASVVEAQQAKHSASAED